MTGGGQGRKAEPDDESPLNVSPLARRRRGRLACRRKSFDLWRINTRSLRRRRHAQGGRQALFKCGARPR
jgi:hypothetical protein